VATGGPSMLAADLILVTGATGNTGFRVAATTRGEVAWVATTAGHGGVTGERTPDEDAKV
jgi:hypothetical protein